MQENILSKDVRIHPRIWDAKKHLSLLFIINYLFKVAIEKLIQGYYKLKYFKKQENIYNSE